MKRVSNAEFEQMVDEITRQVVAKMGAEPAPSAPKNRHLMRRQSTQSMAATVKMGAVSATVRIGSSSSSIRAQDASPPV